jgi:hypothetical protein
MTGKNATEFDPVASQGGRDREDWVSEFLADVFRILLGLLVFGLLPTMCFRSIEKTDLGPEPAVQQDSGEQDIGEP